ncbi:MAG: hypothetical protein HC817_11675 [Saprospiraceae bacterium]|nr:hypothetical protein [Saprospiraceae bacterium]
MALIQKIREKSGLVLALMILAIASFIAMLITQDSNRNWSDFSNTTTVASVNGNNLDLREMERTVETLFPDRAGDLNVRNALFNYFVENTLVEKEAQALGLGVCKDELLDLEFGPNPSPVITQTPGLQNPEQLAQIKQAIQTNQLPPQFKAYWAEIEKQVVKERLQSKISSMIYRAIYTPSWLADATEKANGETVDIEFVRVPFDRVEDKDVTITDEDYKNYINDNSARFDADEESRQIEYVAFDVIPSEADSAKLREKIYKTKSEFQLTKNDTTFVTAYNGEIARTPLTKAQVSQVVADSLFSVPVGSIVGPYIDAKAFVLSKVLERRTSPDSVRSRHILIRGGAEAMKTADSLKIF